MSDYKIFCTILILFTTLFISCGSDSPVDPQEENIPTGNFSLLTPQQESTVIYNQPTLAWEDVEHPDTINISYEIRFDTKSPPSTVITDGLDRHEYKLDYTLDPGTTYYWQVISNLSNGEKFKSKEIYSFEFIEGSGVIANKNMGMLLRKEHSLLVFQGKLWMFGGRQNRFGKIDIWFSEDGINWELATEEAEFHAREQHTALVYDDKIWMIGGYTVGGFFKDVWYTEDGNNWIEAADDTPLGRRSGHSSVVFDDKMWVIGGSEISDDLNDSFIHNDAWYSTDGVHWTQATDDAGFEPRAGHKSAVFDNKMWVIGGRFLNEETDFSSTTDDVWYSENGSDWTIATNSSGFGHLDYFDCIVFDNKIWIIGGLITDDSANGTVGTVSKEIWYSSDGINWKKTVPFFGRYHHANAVFKNKIWGVGGSGAPTNNNDSWYLDVP